MNIFIQRYGIHIVIVLFSFIPIIISEGIETFFLIKHLYKVFFTIGLYYLCFFMYRFFIGKIISGLLIVLLTLNLSASLIARFVYSSKFDGTQATNILLTNNSEGTYHFGVFALDTSGNQNLVWQNIHIHND